MVTLSQVHASNAQLGTTFQSGLVAVFVGATSGIGLYTLKSFAKHTAKPRVYFVGRSQEAGNRIARECQALNPEGSFTFIQSDVSLLKNVDSVCKRIKASEGSLNLLVLSQGTLVFGKETEEGLQFASALILHSRFRFVLNLLPLLQRGSGLRRVVSVFAATKEGKVDVSDIEGRNVSLMASRGHMASCITFGFESLARKAPEVGFVHVYPGFVKSGLARGTTGVIMGILKFFSAILNFFLSMDPEECGDRHVFLCTSRRYAGKIAGEENGVTLVEGIEPARSSDGEAESGVYSVQQHGESAGHNIEQLLASMRHKGVVEQVWDKILEDFERITTSKSI